MTPKFDRIVNEEEYSEELAYILFKIDQIFFPTPWDLNSWKELFNHDSRFLCIAWLEQEIIGFSLFNTNVVDSFAHLLKIVIIPEYQRKGTGEALLRTALQFLACDKGVKKYFLEVEIENKSAIALYQKSGFKIIHTKKHFYGNGKDAFVMTI